MIKRTALLLAWLLPAAALSAAPVITSISPTTATVKPGTHVTIKGSGFSSCIICSPPLPPAVFFGGTPADSVRLIDSETLDVTTPAHLPATVRVSVQQFDGTVFAPQSFTFTGDPLEAFDRILVPIFMGPVHGAFGSEFVTVVRASDKSDFQTVRVYGADLRCLAIMPVMDPLSDPIVIEPAGILSYREIPPDCSSSTGIFLYVPKTQSASLTLNDRVTDVSRTTASHGTEIPIVHTPQFANRIVLLGVPIDGRYRSTLRIYAATAVTVRVTVGGMEPQNVVLQPGHSIFEPAYGTFTDFPIPIDPIGEGQTTLRVVIDGPPGPAGPSPIIPGPPIWAFITVTNNQTQQITTISPD